MLVGFPPSRSQFQGQREDLEEVLKVDFLVVASLSRWIGVGRSLRSVGGTSSRPCWRSELVAYWGVSLLHASSWLYRGATSLYASSHLGGGASSHIMSSHLGQSGKLAGYKLTSWWRSELARGMSSCLTSSPLVSGVSLLLVSSRSQGRELTLGPCSYYG